MDLRLPDRKVSPAEFIAALDAVAPEYIRPWFKLASASLARDGLSWNVVAVTLQLQIEKRHAAGGSFASLTQPRLRGDAHD